VPTIGRRHFVKQAFSRLHYRGAAKLEDAELTSCSFDGCKVVCLDHRERVTVERVNAARCSEKSSTIRGMILRQCRITDLKSSGLLIVSSCLFDRVTLSGRFDRLMVTPTWAPETAAFDAELAKEQSNVDWALDISETEAKALDIRGIPADLIRRDEETQALVRADIVREADWENVATGIARFAILLMLERNQPSCVIVAPKRNKKKFAEVMLQISTLRKAGLAE